LHIPGPAAGRQQRLLRSFPGCTAVVFGHTHVPHIEEWQGVWLLNPGSPCDRRRAPTKTMLELRVNAEALMPTVVDFGP
jgi:putative phosphoesterase